jgi:transposase/outer membrane murein-binding lipoprotein Lpp
MLESAPPTSDVLLGRVAELESALAAERAAHASSRATVERLTTENEHLRAAHDRLRQDLELLRRRIFIAKAERIDSTQLELEFAKKLAALDQLSAALEAKASDAAGAGADPAAGGDRPARGGGKGKSKPKGRRDLSTANLPEDRIEIPDPALEALVAAGKAERIGFEQSYKLGWQRGGPRRVVIARVKYRTVDEQGVASFTTTPMPPQTFERSLAAPSMLAHVASDKHLVGVPLYRIEDRSRRDGTPLDRGTMCRWLEDAGSTAGATVVAAMRKEALATAFCLSTDATGILVQPIPTGDGKRQPCRKGHYFVQIADRDHVFFEFTPRETSAAVGEMFRGFSGYVQADAKSVFDILFRESQDGQRPLGPELRPEVRWEVACWTHARRGLWEAAIATKSPVAREGLYRIRRLYQLDESWRTKAPDEIKRLRNLHCRPLLDAFFPWAQAEYDKVKGVRGLLRSGLGYLLRQKDALMRFLEDGRLRMDNNHSEGEIKRIALGRKAWLFVGSDDHAASAGHLFSLIASARLHRLDPELYLRDLFRVLGHWPKDRYLELAPKYWAATRARLDPDQLFAEVGPLTVPPPPADNPQDQAPPR